MNGDFAVGLDRPNANPAQGTGRRGETADPQLLGLLYEERFTGLAAYRNQVWKVLIEELFASWIPATSRVFDVGCGHGEFINNVTAGQRSAMDLNPATKQLLDDEVTFYERDCTVDWPVSAKSQDVVFSSNFIEHLMSKDHVLRLFQQAHEALEVGGRIILLGPNIRVINGKYWDFFDHHVALTERSVSEALVAAGFEIEICRARVLPYTMSTGRQYPTFLLRTYLRMPFAWRIFGEQFLVVARRPD